MSGTVRCFVPAARRGLLETDSGEALVFSVVGGGVDLQGGDVVEFELDGEGRPRVHHVTLRHRWSELLNERHRTLVNQFHDTIEIRA